MAMTKSSPPRAPRPREPSSRRTLWLSLGCTIGLGVLSLPNPAPATERGASHYFPGATRDFAVAVARAPGARFTSETRFANGRHQLRGTAGTLARAEIFRATELLGAFYSFERNVLGGRVEIGATLPVGFVRTDAASVASAGRAGLGDVEFIPLAWHWSWRKLHLKVQEKIFAPTGGFSRAHRSDIGLHYWSFDSSLAATWFNDGSGTELSAEAGLLTHRRNASTGYKTGDEFHLDFALNQFWTPHFAFGARGYYYNQVGSDRLGGSTLRGVEARALGFGPALEWAPEAFDRKLRITGSWLRDVESQNRSHGSHARLTLTFMP